MARCLAPVLAVLFLAVPAVVPKVTRVTVGGRDVRAWRIADRARRDLVLTA